MTLHPPRRLSVFREQIGAQIEWSLALSLVVSFLVFDERYDDTGRDLGTIDCTACTMTAQSMGFFGLSHILHVLFFFVVGVYHGTTRHGA